jgi:peroxiredoxin Q/BCP
MALLRSGDPAPDFAATAHNGREIRLADYQGKSAVVLYFYPRDGSALCTKQACGFRDAYEEFSDLGTVVIGVSGDPLQRHREFAAGRALPFLLVSDRDGALRKAYRVPKMLGIVPGRVTYVIDKQGIVRHVFSALFSAEKHIAEALKIVRELVDEREERP